MFYPIGWHKVLRLDSDPTSKILSIIANSERELHLILTTTSVHLWNPRPPIEIACHRRSDESIAQIGANKSVVWKIDSSVFVIATENDQLLFFRLHQRLPNSTTWTSFMSLSGSQSEMSSLYKLKCELKNLKNTLGDNIYRELLRTKSSDSKYQTIPAISIMATGKLDLSSTGVSCLMAAEEELIVGGKHGDFYGIHWNGNVDVKFPWSIEGIPIDDGVDESGTTSTSSNKDIIKTSGDCRKIYIRDIKFSSVLSGFVIIFTNGRAYFMPLKETQPSSETTTNDRRSGSQSPPKTNNNNNTSSNNNTNNNHSNSNNNNNNNTLSKNKNRLTQIPSDNCAICVEINHKYRLIAIGLNDSRVIVCNVSEPGQSIVLNHRLEFRQDKFPNISHTLGAIKCMRYSPDSFALATTWESGHFALWSLFGSLLFCSEQWRNDSTIERPVFKAANLCWGREGHSLWMDTNEELVILSIAHTTLSTSPHLTCSSDSIVLLGEERLHVGPSVPHEAEFDHWHIIDIPYDYLASNYPIRYATVDRNCSEVAIAGNNGFALYSIATSKWTMFNKKSQEMGFTICGDIIWWNGYLIMSCYNLETENFEIRAYPSKQRLDNENLISQVVPLEVIRMSLFENRLLVLYADGNFAMFMINLRKRPRLASTTSTTSSFDNYSSGSSSSGSASLPPAPELSNDSPETKPKLKRSDSIISQFSIRRKLSNLSNYPAAPSIDDVSLQISPMQNLIVSNLQANPYCISSIALTRLHFKNNRLDDSILLNYCGKLFLLERELPASKKSDVAFQAVSVIATNVEQFWISPEISTASEMSYFRKSLWLSCGGSAKSQLQVWLPLLNDKADSPTDLYVPDRIMLPIRCDIYPLSIRSSNPMNEIGSDDAIVLGAETDILYRDNELFCTFPFNTVKRQCRVYLHRILRELLLKQHLGYYARKIAESCQTLPYFAHCFELLLHEVLEEEATSPVPLPDPMLPQVVEFIKKFPVYLETVVHCARKSELSMWSHLFAEQAVGNPEHLFQECLNKGKLDTASSCLLILESLDKIVSHKMITDLIEAAKQDDKFGYLIEDLEKFSIRAELTTDQTNHRSSVQQDRADEEPTSKEHEKETNKQQQSSPPPTTTIENGVNL